MIGRAATGRRTLNPGLGWEGFAPDTNQPAATG